MENANIPPCFYRVSVKALVHNSEWKFLLTKEDNGLWEMPGGWVDHGEDPRECLMREVHEEMWLEVTSMAEQPSYFFTSTSRKGVNIANVLYATTLKDLNFTPSDECVAIWFFTLNEAKNLETFPNIQSFLKVYNPANHVHL
jgi:8-oxo-dGTP diphosphatase